MVAWHVHNAIDNNLHYNSNKLEMWLLQGEIIIDIVIIFNKKTHTNGARTSDTLYNGLLR